jgi:predicted nucleotidyltransferase
VTLISAASQVLAALGQENVKGCIVGGLAVSSRCDPRFTRDVDIAVAVETDEQAEDGLSVDLLIASSGIETEVVTKAETLEVVQGVLLPVARTGHLIALKLLSVAPGRETDAADLRNIAAVATEEEWNLASEAVTQIQERGFARGRQLDSELHILRNSIL